MNLNSTSALVTGSAHPDQEASSSSPHQPDSWEPQSKGLRGPAHYNPDPHAEADWGRVIAEAEEFMKSLFPDSDFAEASQETSADSDQAADLERLDRPREPRAARSDADEAKSGRDAGEKYVAYLGILDRLPVRREIFIRELEKSKLNPHELVHVTQTMPGGLRGAPRVSHIEKSRLDICLDNQLSTFPLNFATSERERLKDCPKNELFFEEFKNYWQDRLNEVARIVSSRLSSIGVDLNASTATLYQTVACCRPVRIHVGEGQLGEPDSKIEDISIAGHRGFIVFIDQGKQAFSVLLAEDEIEIERVPLEDFRQLAGHSSFIISVEPDKEAFSISLAEGEIEIERVPLEELQESQRTANGSWIARHKDSFFSRAALDGLQGRDFSLTRMTEPAPVHEALQDLSKALLIPRQSFLKDYAYGETNMEAAIHNAREVLVPCYIKTRDELLEKCAVDLISLVSDMSDYFRLAKGAMPVKAAGNAKKLAAAGEKGPVPAGKTEQSKPVGKSGLSALFEKISLGRAPKSRKPVELIRRFPKSVSTSYPPAVQRELAKLDRLIRENPGLRQLICKPTDHCADSLEPVVAALKDAGYTTQSRGMYWWEGVDDLFPENHFVVIAKKDNFEYAVDVTAAQYDEIGIKDAVIDTEAGWAKKFHDAAKDYLIKYKDFADPTQAKHAFYSGLPRGPDEIIPRAEDAIILSKPAWYGKNAKFKSVYKYTEAEHGTVERIGRRYFIKAKHHRRELASSNPKPQSSPVENAANFLEQPGNWDADAGDFATHAVANSLRRPLEIHYPDPDRVPTVIAPFASRGGATGAPIRLYYTGDHYNVLIGGRQVVVDGDGDCLFRAVLKGLGQQDNAPNIQNLRRLAAQDIRNNPDDFRDFAV